MAKGHTFKRLEPGIERCSQCKMYRAERVCASEELGLAPGFLSLIREYSLPDGTVVALNPARAPKCER